MDSNSWSRVNGQCSSCFYRLRRRPTCEVNRLFTVGGPRDSMGRAARKWQLRRCMQPMECRDAPAERLSRSLVALDQKYHDHCVVELSQSSWLIGGIVPGIERQPHKKLEPSPERLLAVLHRWRDEAVRAGRKITRIALASKPSRRFWLARWLRRAGGGACDPSLECRVSREHRGRRPTGSTPSY